MKTKRIIAAICALTICFAAGGMPTARSGTPVLLTAIAEGEEEIQSLEDAEVSVDVANRTVAVKYDGVPVDPGNYTLIFYFSDTDEFVGNEFPEAPGKYYVSVEATENNETYEGSIECEFEIIADNVDLVDTDFAKVSSNRPKAWSNSTEHADYEGFTGKVNDGIRLVLTSNCGIIVAAKDCGEDLEYVVSKIEAMWNSGSDNGAKLLVYGSTKPYEAVGDLYDDTKNGRESISTTITTAHLT